MLTKTEIQKLFNACNYQEVIDNVKDENDVDLLYLKILSYAFLDDFETSIALLNSNKAKLIKDLPKFIDITMNLCFYFKKYDLALDYLKEFEEMPYESQIVEEKMQKYKKEITKLLNNVSNLQNNVESIQKMLKSENDEIVKKGISSLKNYKIELFLPELENIMLNNSKESTRTLALIALQDSGFDKEVKFNYHGEIIKIIPNTILGIFNDPTFKYCIEQAKIVKDPTYYSTFESVLSLYALYCYPFKLCDNPTILFLALDNIVSEMLNNNLQQNVEISANCKDLINKITDIIRNF